MLTKLFYLTLLVHIGITTSLGAKGTELTISECAAKGGECDETKGRPVCGTDNQTYPTRCHLIRAQCSGHQVSLKHRGTCKDACIASRSYALSHRSTFVPKCRMDGSYAAVQCVENSECWCVTSLGKPIPNTTVRTGKPICVKAKKTNIRRSPPRNGDRRKRNCSQTDRSLFNTNLIEMFHSEHTRYNPPNSQMKFRSTITDKIVLDWKFSLLDINKNHMLDKNEYRELKRLAKKFVKPKRCARTFGKACDIDHDERLSRQEWSKCLSKDGLNPETDTTAGSSNTNTDLHQNQGQLTHNQNSFDDFEEEYEDESDEQMTGSDNTLGGPPASSPITRYKPILLLRGKTTLLNGDSEADPGHRDTDPESDCLGDRAAALDEQESGTEALYIPECTPDGRFQRVQCYRSTGYCWCVHEDSGKNIPGTSTKDVRPQCDAITPPSRPMKGCPEVKKNAFLKELKEFFKAQIASNGNTGVNSTKWRTEDEKIATLSFVLLDKNKNKVWERKEWKTFRDLVTAMKQLRKCGKKMPRYCDVNNDRKITLSEWLNCLQAQRLPAIEFSKPPPLAETRAPSQTKLKGPNPLESYLKSDR